MPFVGRFRFVAMRPIGEVFLQINSVLHYLWRAVDQHGVLLDILVQAAGMRRPPSGSSSVCSPA